MTRTPADPPTTTARLAAALADFAAFLARHPHLPTPATLVTTVTAARITVAPSYNPDQRHDGTDAEVRTMVADWARALGSDPADPFPYSSRTGLLLHTTEARLTTDLTVHIHLLAPAEPAPAAPTADLINA